MKRFHQHWLKLLDYTQYCSQRLKKQKRKEKKKNGTSLGRQNFFYQFEKNDFFSTSAFYFLSWKTLK